MPVEDDPAWDQWSKALDQLVDAGDRFAVLPEDHPEKKAAWTAVRLAQRSLELAALEIEPKYQR